MAPASDPPVMVLTINEQKSLVGIALLNPTVPDIDYKALSAMTGQKYPKNCRAAVKKLYEKLRAFAGPLNINPTALVAMDVDDDEGEEDAKEESIAQGASTNKRATSNKVVKKATAKSAGPKSAVPKQPKAAPKKGSSRPVRHAQSGSNKVSSGSDGQGNQNNTTPEDGEDEDMQSTENEEDVVTTGPAKKPPVKRASHSGTAKNTASNDQAEVQAPAKKPPVKRASRSKGPKEVVNDEEVDELAPAKKPPVKRASRSKTRKEIVNDNEQAGDKKVAVSDKKTPVTRKSRAKKGKEALNEGSADEDALGVVAESSIAAKNEAPINKASAASKKGSFTGLQHIQQPYVLIDNATDGGSVAPPPVAPAIGNLTIGNPYHPLEYGNANLLHSSAAPPITAAGSATPMNGDHLETFDEYSARIREMSLEDWMIWKNNNPYAMIETDGTRAVTPEYYG